VADRTIDIELLDQDMTRTDIVEALERLKFVGCQFTATIRLDRGVQRYLLRLLRDRR
jgi:hypothetical protein